MTVKDYADLLQSLAGDASAERLHLMTEAAREVQLCEAIFGNLGAGPLVVMLLDGDPLEPCCFVPRAGASGQLLFVGPRRQLGRFVLRPTSRGYVLARNLSHQTIN